MVCCAFFEDVSMWSLALGPQSLPQVCEGSLNALPLPCLQLMLPDGVTVEVIVVNQVNAGHLFVQQHTHPTFHALRSLDQQMYLCYSQPGIPTLPTPVESKRCPRGQRGAPALWPGSGRSFGGGSSLVLPMVLTSRRLFWGSSWE